MTRLLIGISLVAFATLMLELLLTRVFDVILTPNMAYMVITCAMFSFGLAGIYVTLRPPPPERDTRRYLAVLSALFAASTVALLPVLNFLPFDYEQITQRPVVQTLAFLSMYLALVMPFFFAGLIMTTLFSAFARRIQTIYLWDLAGAAVGSVIMIPLIGPIGPGGLLFVASAMGFAAAAAFSSRTAWSIVAVAVGMALVAAPVLRAPEYFEFKEHLSKRGVKRAKVEGLVELTRWDPVSKIDVIDRPITSLVGNLESSNRRKHVAYDGGTQSTHIYPFDGDYASLRDAIESGQEAIWEHFWHRGVLASHYLKKDTGYHVLIIGSAGGQETKAALMYGAARVDGIELVKTVVDLGKGAYAEFNGGIFNDPRVSVAAGEGRSFLRSSRSTYDIIQIHSNHTSSSIAAGTGAMAPTYLQTADAYREYFEHLKSDGILHINHHAYPRMISTAALAWREMGREAFQKHVLVFEMVGVMDTLPTYLVKMSPWTHAEIETLRGFFDGIGPGEIEIALVQNPMNAEESFLPSEFFSGDFPDALANAMEFHATPATDDRPYFSFLRKHVRELEPDDDKFTSVAMALLLNSQLRLGIIPMDTIHLIVAALSSLFFAIVFVVLPLRFSRVGRADWECKYVSLIYFACLGSGFIIIELIFIQIFMKLVGFPVHTYAVVIFTLLLAAGLGSQCSKLLSISARKRWSWPFLGILVSGLILVWAHPMIFGHFLSSAAPVRVLIAGLLIFPLGFFLGMPFPLGILALENQPSGAIAWAWGMNGLFTVAGGLASVALGLIIGFKATIVVALGIYLLAFWCYSRLRLAVA